MNHYLSGNSTKLIHPYPCVGASYVMSYPAIYKALESGFVDKACSIFKRYLTRLTRRECIKLFDIGKQFPSFFELIIDLHRSGRVQLRNTDASEGGDVRLAIEREHMILDAIELGHVDIIESLLTDGGYDYRIVKKSVDELRPDIERAAKNIVEGSVHIHDFSGGPDFMGVNGIQSYRYPNFDNRKVVLSVCNDAGMMDFRDARKIYVYNDSFEYLLPKYGAKCLSKYIKSAWIQVTQHTDRNYTIDALKVKYDMNLMPHIYDNLDRYFQNNRTASSRLYGVHGDIHLPDCGASFLVKPNLFDHVEGDGEDEDEDDRYNCLHGMIWNRHGLTMICYALP